MPSGCYRSPYRLYRPYQLEVPPPSALVNGSATLYRTPNLDVLSEINRRSRRLERIVFYQKILAITQLLFSLLLIILEMTKILLAWEHFKFWEQKFILVCEICQPIFFVVASFVLLFCVLRPTKCTSQIAIASLVATIAPLLIFPTHSPFVISAVEAVHINRLINQTPMLADQSYPEISTHINTITDFQRIRRLSQLPIFSLTKTDFEKRSTLSSTESLSSSTSSFSAIQQLLSLQYLLIAYAFFSLAYSIVLILTLISYIQLLQLQ